MLKKILRKQGGFTLLELLIVIVIIGILALLIIPNITSAPKKARDTQRKTDLRAIQKGMEEYFVSNNIYPVDMNTLTTGTTPIMKAVPTDPKNTSPYVYVYTPAASNTTYDLTACLENGGDNGTATIAPVAPCTTRTFQLVNNN
ncbi:prepilin-type N-terminal cleavage/methylation domain-containing protein [Candidatus Saccharibacteria bacterium]|nr:prepilin-type N-terminal cleavage/methylation domain-containing protein [Candidatus Saccharibacteria bacterium]